jgi:hypothetical protein
MLEKVGNDTNGTFGTVFEQRLHTLAKSSEAIPFWLGDPCVAPCLADIHLIAYPTAMKQRYTSGSQNPELKERILRSGQPAYSSREGCV